jgi:2-C-methyl-D-erythritol 4-phosphate cytidylyltransferase
VSSAAAVVLAAGSGTRVGGEINKVYLPLGGRRLVSWSIEALSAVPEIGVLLLVTRPSDGDLAEEAIETAGATGKVEIVAGGDSRQGSELAALRRLADRITSGEIDTVLIHDAARPLVTPVLAGEVLRAAREHGGAIPGLPSQELLTVDADGGLVVHGDGPDLVAVQTPQGFRAPELLDAYETATREGFVGTDTASCIERFSPIDVRWVMGERRNFKITYPHDLKIAERILGYTDRRTF